MPEKIGKKVTKRHSLPFDSIPTMKGSVWGYSIRRYTPEDYSAILDSAYEMVDMIAHSNNTTFKDAMAQVLKDEGWYLLPTHKRMILIRLIQG